MSSNSMLLYQNIVVLSNSVDDKLLSLIKMKVRSIIYSSLLRNEERTWEFGLVSCPSGGPLHVSRMCFYNY